MKTNDIEVFRIIKNSFNRGHTYFITQITSDTLIETNYYKNVGEYLVSNYLVTSGGMIENLKGQFLMQKGYNIKEIKRLKYKSLPKMVRDSIKQMLDDYFSRHYEN